MNPNATLEQLLAAIAAGDFETASEYDEHLVKWLARGGFMPSELESIAEELTGEFSSFYNGADDNAMDFRIYIRPDGALELAVGDASFDTDHRGYCGAGCIVPEDAIDGARAAVLDCFNDAIETAFQSA